MSEEVVQNDQISMNEEDEFGSFSDASFDDFEEPQVIENSIIKLPQSVFSNPQELEIKLEELVNLTFPGSLPEYENNEDTSILNERSEQLLERLTSLIYLKPYNWQKSSLRKQLLVTLGISDIDNNSRKRLNQFDADEYIVTPFKELNINDDEKLKLIDETDYILEDYLTNLKNDDELNKLSDEELSEINKDYNLKLKMVENLLSIWENEKFKLTEDKNTFESVVENLIGHTQRIRREESFKSQQKEKEKSKGISSIFRKKKK